MNKRFALPLVLFLFIVVLLWRGLGLHPNQIPSPLINQPAPIFQLPLLFKPEQLTSNQDFIGHITLLNIWATWCSSCVEQHPFLLSLAKDKTLTLVGLVYKDNPSKVKAWLAEEGNPYQSVAIDETGKAAIDWGVYGTPETFVIDRKGIIRYKQIGSITVDVWEKDLKPLLEKLRHET